MTCECGHIKAQHQFNGKFCFLCSCTKYRKQTKNESTPDASILTSSSEIKNESTPDEAYLDRNLVVQVLARLSRELGYKVGIKDDSKWPILYIDLPTGQVSWHIPKKELIGDWPIYQGKWDGHDLETKRNRLKAYMEAMK